ncbi:hypothetical protein AB0L64_20605 [Kribbella sp. NPDC051936]|uniref:hypothetical protein n=1 Tax=Kribbella sp. NPDC051936 TaxID=3154946 RepID=UPI00343E00AD
MEEEPSYWRDRFPAGRRLGALLGGLAAYGGAALLGHGWGACDVGVNAGANSATLLFFVLPFLFGLLFAVVSGSTRRQKLLGVLAVFAWFVFAGKAHQSTHPTRDAPAVSPPGGRPGYPPD